MPADAGAGPVFIDQSLHESLRRPAGEGGDLCFERFEKIRNRRRLNHRRGARSCSAGQSDHAPVGEMTVGNQKASESSSQDAEPRSASFVDAQEICVIAKAFGREGERAERSGWPAEGATLKP